MGKQHEKPFVSTIPMVTAIRQNGARSITGKEQNGCALGDSK
jgi:hypothetical protein